MQNSEMNDFVNRVRERTDIYSVVSRYVQLNQRGGRYWGRCPFHSEKTASFTINTEKGFFYCFGCHAGGNVFKFISMIENVSYFEAIKLQAERLGIPLPSRNKTPEEIQRERGEKLLLKINEAAREFFFDCLKKPAGEIGRKYLNERGITDSAIENFKLGFSPNSWDALSSEFLRRGFSPKQLVDAGISSPRKNGSGIYDRFRGRIMIPITDVFGRVVAFGGRILNAEEENSPKYLNTSETLIFNKRKLLFGLDKAHLEISSKNFAVVVEGYMDAISLASTGIKNVVATLGTAFTSEHAKLLMRYTGRIVFCYDSDEAGQRATIRALPIVQDAGAEVFIVVVPDGKDPDEFVRRHGREAFERLIKSAVSPIEYRLKYVLKNTPHSTLDGKIKALREILPVVAGVKDTAVKNEYRKKLSAALLLDEGMIQGVWENFSKDNSKQKEEKKFTARETKNFPAKKNLRSSVKKNLAAEKAGESVLRMAWHDGGVLGYVLSLVPKETFTEVHQEIISYLEKCIEEERQADDLSAARELSEAANAEISRILTEGANEPEGAELDAFQDSVKKLRTLSLKIRYAKVLREAEEYISTGNPAYIQKMQESVKLKEEMDAL